MLLPYLPPPLQFLLATYKRSFRERERDMNNVTNTDSLIQVCAYAPTISPTVLSYLKSIYFYYVIYPWFCVGLTFAFNSKVLRIVGVLIQVFLSQFLWYLQTLIKWSRPETLIANCPGVALLQDSSLNKYGAPNTLLTSAFVYAIVFVFIRRRILSKGYDWMVIFISGAAFLSEFVTEMLLLGRLLWSQFFVNLAILVTLAALFCGGVLLFYENTIVRIEAQAERENQKRAQKRAAKADSFPYSSAHLLTAASEDIPNHTKEKKDRRKKKSKTNCW